MIQKLYFNLTKHYPRLKPKTAEEFEALKEILVNHFGLDNEPWVWIAVASRLQGEKGIPLRKSYASLVNSVKQMKINETCEVQKRLAAETLQAKLKEQADKLVAIDGGGALGAEEQQGS